DEKRNSGPLVLAEISIGNVVHYGGRIPPAGPWGVCKRTEFPLRGKETLSGCRGPGLGEDALCGVCDGWALWADGFVEIVVEGLDARVQSRRQMDVVRVHSGNRKEHVPGQLPLNTNYKLLVIGLVDVPGQFVNLRAAQNRRAVEEFWTEWKARQWWEGSGVPLPPTGNLGRWLTDGDSSI